MKKFYVIDGNAYIHRAYHALPPLSTSKNQQVNAVYGFIKLLLKIKKNFNPDFMAVCFDYPEKNFRHTIYKEYKANRKALDEALISQMPIAREAAKALNIAELEVRGFEADDLIATVAHNNYKDKVQTVIVTGDKDILQLVEDDQTLVWNDSKDILFNEEKVEEKFDVSPKQLRDVFALMGDASDNVPGIKGIGEKTAVKLIKEYGTLEKILDNADKVSGKTGELLRNGKDAALMSKKLVSLDEEVPLKYEISDFISKETDINTALPFFEKYEFKSLIKQFSPESAAEVKKEEKKETMHSTKFSYEIIDNKEKAVNIAEEIKEIGVFAIKTITTSEDSLKTQIVGVSLAFNNKAYYFPAAHNDLTASQLSFDDFKEVFKDVFTDKKIKKTGYDLKRERNIYKMLNINLKNIYFDVMIASYCLNPSASHDLSYLADEELKLTINDDSFLGKASKKISFADASIEKTADHANQMAVSSFALYEIFEKRLKNNKLNELFYDIEMPLVEVLSDMEIAGIKVDTKFLHSFNEKIVKEIKGIEKKIYEAAGKEFNINSPKQLSVIMFEKLNLPVIKKTKTGYSTDEEVLRELSSYEFPAEILKYRELQKLKTTYIDPITNYCVYYGDRIHTIFNQTVTATGRLSSTEPNLQNIPIKSEYGREFRKAFIAEDKKIFISADYSQIDLRVLAHLSQDEKLIESFKEGEDIHSATAREVFNIPKNKEVPTELRNASKAINFGIVYGMSPYGLSKQLDIPVVKAKEYIDGYFERYKGVKKWTKDIVTQAKKDGYVCTITGRVRYIDELKSTNTQVKLAGERMAMNTPVQGSSADIIKIAMVNIYNEIKEKNYEALMLLQVHDDLLFEVSEKIEESFSKIIKEKMESAVKLKVPLIVDVKKGKNWGEMRK